MNCKLKINERNFGPEFYYSCDEEYLEVKILEYSLLLAVLQQNSLDPTLQQNPQYVDRIVCSVILVLGLFKENYFISDIGVVYLEMFLLRVLML